MDYVYPAFVTLLFPASSFFSESVCLLLLLFCFLSSFPPYVFLFYLWLIGQFVPAVSFNGKTFWISLFVCICLHPDAMSYVVLISNLLYQSAAIVFLDGGRVSKGLVLVSLAFHLFVAGTVIFASVRLLCQVKSSQELLYSKENVVPHIKPQSQCTSIYVKD